MTFNRKQCTILLIQILLFYLFPLLSKWIGALEMVFCMLAVTIVLAYSVGTSMVGKVWFLYPVFVAVAFVPSVFLYYNMSAMIQTIWYFVASSAGMAVGASTHYLNGK